MVVCPAKHICAHKGLKDVSTEKDFTKIIEVMNMRTATNVPGKKSIVTIVIIRMDAVSFCVAKAIALMSFVMSSILTADC